MAEHSVSPLSDPGTLDVAGARKSGGLDMVISCSGPLDDSDQTLSLLDAKVRAYIAAAQQVGFLERFGADPGDVRIFISCTYPVSKRALSRIESLRNEANVDNIELRLVERMGHCTHEPPNNSMERSRER